MDKEEKRLKHNEYMREYYRTNEAQREKNKAKAKARYYRRLEEDPEGVREEGRRSTTKYRKANPEKVKALHAKHAKINRARAMEYVRAIKDSSVCTDCGLSFHHAAMDYDHISDDKTKNVGLLVASGASISRIDKEIAKCELVCSNCHRVRTYNRRQT